MKIGDKTYTTRRPDDLDGQLTAAIGLNAAETAAQLAGRPLPHVVAAAMRPFLPASAPSVPELASAIDGDGFDQVLCDVRDLYSEKPAAASSATK